MFWNGPLRVVFALLALLLMADAAAAQAPGDHFGPQGPPFTAKGPIAIVGGTLIDATGAPAKENQVVLIDNGLIKAVGPAGSITIPENAHRIDATGMSVMPGLISSNQHVQLNPLYPAPAADLPIDELRARWERNFAEMPKRAFIYLMQGITSMRQTSGPLKRLLPLKRRIDAGELPGPRIFVGGALLSSPVKFDLYIHKNRTPPEAVEWLRNEFAFLVVDDIDKDLEPLMGPEINFWKITFGEEPFDGHNDFTDEEVRRIIDKAHKAGKFVDIHANATPEGFKRLLKFDFDTLEHPFYVNYLWDEAAIAALAKKGIVVDTLLRLRIAAADQASDPHRFNEVKYFASMDPDEYRMLMRYRDKFLHLQRNPTLRGLSVYDKRASLSDEFGQAGPSYEDMQKDAEIARQNMRRFIRAGVKFSTGTDSPTFMNFLQENPYALEMGYMVEMGLSPMEAIIASTRNGAEVLGMLDKLGTIEPGKIADVIIVPGNPLQSMDVMQRVAVVIKDGVRYK